jgi:heat shock protein HtpX
MKRRDVGRDLGLSVRMAVALVLLGATYVALVLVVVALFVFFPKAWPYWVAVSAAVGFSLVVHYRSARGTLLGSIGGRLVPRGEENEIEDVLEKLAAMAGIPTPRLAVVETDVPNALAVGLSQRGAVVVVTRGLRKRLTPQELEAVLAHEVAHLANRDAAVMTAVAVPRTLGEVIVGGPASSTVGLVWLLIWPLGIFPLGIGTGLTLTVSRYREYAADRGSALLTGAPEQLMSALRKLAGHAAEIPHEDLRAANAFCIVSTEAARLRLFSDHPPLEKRLTALATIAREMGRPVS